MNILVEKGTDLRHDSVGKLLFKLAVPAILAQVINALYNIVDRIYIGNLPGEVGTQSIAALGVCLPLIMIVSALGAMIGVGGSALAAIRMGEEQQEKAETILGNCLPLLVGISAVVTLVCRLFLKDLLLLVGATENTLGYAAQYFGLYVWGTLPVLLVLGLNMFINTQGFATTSMLTVLLGAVCNIVLDPILIYGCNMGVRGAAIATVLSQSVSAVWVLCFLCGKKTRLRLRVSRMRPQWGLIGSVLALGLSPFIMQSTESLVVIVINTTLKAVSPDLATADLYISAYSIIASVMQLVLLPVQGLGQGLHPIISYNYGAKQFDRVKRTFWLCLRSCLAFVLLVWAAVMAVPGVFVRLFNSDPTLLALTIPAMRIYMCMLMTISVQFTCQQTFVATGQAKASLLLALLRKILLLIPLILIFSRIWGTLGVFIAEPVADTLAATITGWMFFRYRRTIFEGLPHRQPKHKEENAL